jgi:hypothetical protein
MPIVCGSGSGAMQAQQISPARILVPPRARFLEFCLRAESAIWRIQNSHRCAFVTISFPFMVNFVRRTVAWLSGIASGLLWRSAVHRLLRFPPVPGGKRGEFA